MCDLKADGGLRCPERSVSSINAAQARYDATASAEDRNDLVRHYSALAAKDPDAIQRKINESQPGPGGLPASYWQRVIDNGHDLAARADALKAINRQYRGAPLSAGHPDYALAHQWRADNERLAQDASEQGKPAPNKPVAPDAAALTPERMDQIADRARAAGWLKGVGGYGHHLGARAREIPPSHPAAPEGLSQDIAERAERDLRSGYLSGLRQGARTAGRDGRAISTRVHVGPAAAKRREAAERGWLNGVHIWAATRGRKGLDQPQSHPGAAATAVSLGKQEDQVWAERVDEQLATGWRLGKMADAYEAKHNAPIRRSTSL